MAAGGFHIGFSQYFSQNSHIQRAHLMMKKGASQKSLGTAFYIACNRRHKNLVEDLYRKYPLILEYIGYNREG